LLLSEAKQFARTTLGRVPIRVACAPVCLINLKRNAYATHGGEIETRK
jgi:hypothetical protein